MKTIFAVIILLALVATSFAEPACMSSGLQTADGLIATVAAGNYRCLCGVELIPAAADSTLVLYDNTSAAGTVITKMFAPASGSPVGYPPGATCVNVNTGIYADVTGTNAAYIVWYR